MRRKDQAAYEKGFEVTSLKEEDQEVVEEGCVFGRRSGGGGGT